MSVAKWIQQQRGKGGHEVGVAALQKGKVSSTGAARAGVQEGSAGGLEATVQTCGGGIVGFWMYFEKAKPTAVLICWMLRGREKQSERVSELAQVRVILRLLETGSVAWRTEAETETGE